MSKFIGIVDIEPECYELDNSPEEQYRRRFIQNIIDSVMMKLGFTTLMTSTIYISKEMPEGIESIKYLIQHSDDRVFPTWIKSLKVIPLSNDSSDVSVIDLTEMLKQNMFKSKGIPLTPQDFYIVTIQLESTYKIMVAADADINSGDKALHYVREHLSEWQPLTTIEKNAMVMVPHF